MPIVPGYLPTIDGSPSTPSLRTLGTGANQACAGDDPRLSASTSYDTMADLRADAAPADGTVAQLLGYHSVGDGGQGTFVYDSGSSATEDGGTIIKPTAVGGAGRWIRQFTAGRVEVRWFGAIGDGTTHPLSGYFGSLGAAQAIYPHAISLTDELDWAAAQAAINSVKGAWNTLTRGGEVVFPEGAYLVNQTLDLDWTLGMVLSGYTWGARAGLMESSNAQIVYTPASQYLNPSNTKPCISARTSYYFTLRNLNISYNDPNYWGHLVELSHRGGNTVALQALLPTITFAGNTISRASGSFLDDGWRIGDVVYVQGSVSNNALNGTITGVTDLVITTSGTTWVNEVINFTGTNGIYSQTGDTTFATIQNCTFGSSGATPAGEGAKALLAMTSAILCVVENCFFATAECGILFRDFGGGPGIYSNGHVIRNCTFEYQTDSLRNAGQDIVIDGCFFEGLGGFMVAYRDQFTRLEAATDCTFTFDSGAKTVTRSSGSWITDGWQVGMTAAYGSDGGFYGPMGTITTLTATVMTLDGSVPSYGASYTYYVYNDDVLDNAGIQSDPKVGCTITIAGDTITRSSGSFIDDGWVIGQQFYGYGGGGYPVIKDMTASVITLVSAAPGPGVYTEPSWWIWGDGGGGPLTFMGCWLGDQYRWDSWIHTCGCGGLNLVGNFFNGNARILTNREKLLRGSITGNVLVVGRPKEAILLLGVSGANGLSVKGNLGGDIRFKTVYASANYEFGANASVDPTVASQKTDDTFIQKVERFSKGHVVHSTIYDPYGTTTPRSLLDIRGSLSTAYTSTAVDLVLDRTHSFVDADATSANRTITLPSASGITGREYTIKRVDASGFTCEVAAAGGQTIDGVSTVSLPTQNSSLVVVSNGSNWRIKSAY